MQRTASTGRPVDSRYTDENYDVPARVDPSGLDSVVIWCKQFSVQFAVATLEGERVIGKPDANTAGGTMSRFRLPTGNLEAPTADRSAQWDCSCVEFETAPAAPA